MITCVYGKKFDPEFAPAVASLFAELSKRKAEVRVHEKFYRFLKQFVGIPADLPVFQSENDLRDARLMLSVGGDGTLLDCARIVAGLDLPVLGINTGRLGFLSTVGLDEIPRALEAVFSGDYTIDRRSMIKVTCDQMDLGDRPYALNEVSILNRDRNSMVRIHTHVNEVFMNTYWADGLIVATPTGSTAYSLSCGGPIVSPDSNNFILTPVAAHNLTMRPVVIGDGSRITLRAEGRSSNYILTIDSNSYQFGPEAVIALERAPFDFQLISFGGSHFFHTIRSKMGWGLDKRN